MDLLVRAGRSKRPDDIQGRIYALMVPHAGYTYSGAVAAHGYQLLAGSNISTAIVISPRGSSGKSRSVAEVGRVAILIVLASSSDR